MGRTPKFTPAQLQRAALKIVDDHGLAALSMRSLAAALGTGAMTLYNYVGEREGLDLLVVEAIVGGASWKTPPGSAWHDELRTIARAMWHAVRRHPNAIPLLLTRRSRSPAMFEVAEALLAALSRGGYGGQPRLVAFRAVVALVMGMAQAELAGPLALKAGESADETIARFRALPPDRYPRLIETAGAAAASDAEREFEGALSLLIGALGAGGAA